MDMACWGLIPRFWVKDKGFKEDDAVWGELKQKGADAPPEATELREGAFVATILCDDREEEMEENMEQVSVTTSLSLLHYSPKDSKAIAMVTTLFYSLSNTDVRIAKIQQSHLSLHFFDTSRH